MSDATRPTSTPVQRATKNPTKIAPNKKTILHGEKKLDEPPAAPRRESIPGALRSITWVV
jgi:hypothetical protein